MWKGRWVQSFLGNAEVQGSDNVHWEDGNVGEVGTRRAWTTSLRQRLIPRSEEQLDIYAAI